MSGEGGEIRIGEQSMTLARHPAIDCETRPSSARIRAIPWVNPVPPRVCGPGGLTGIQRRLDVIEEPSQSCTRKITPETRGISYSQSATNIWQFAIRNAFGRSGRGSRASPRLATASAFQSEILFRPLQHLWTYILGESPDDGIGSRESRLGRLTQQIRHNFCTVVGSFRLLVEDLHTL